MQTMIHAIATLPAQGRGANTAPRCTRRHVGERRDADMRFSRRLQRPLTGLRLRRQRQLHGCVRTPQSLRRLEPRPPACTSAPSLGHAAVAVVPVGGRRQAWGLPLLLPRRRPRDEPSAPHRW